MALQQRQYETRDGKAYCNIYFHPEYTVLSECFLLHIKHCCHPDIGTYTKQFTTQQTNLITENGVSCLRRNTTNTLGDFQE